jgi:hypothetical protein
MIVLHPKTITNHSQKLPCGAHGVQPGAAAAHTNRIRGPSDTGPTLRLMLITAKEQQLIC